MLLVVFSTTSSQKEMGWYTSTTLLAASVPLTVVIVDVLRRMLRHCTERRKFPLPPGPTPLPFLGSALSVDAHRPWLTYTAWRYTYGDIIYVRLLDTDVIVLNSASVALELLEKRSSIYSDRPFFPTAVPYGNDCNFSVSPYGEHWRLCRRIFQQTFNVNASLNFRPMQLQRARKLIRSIIDNPKEYSSHFQTYSASIAMSAVYDYEPSAQNDRMVSNIDNYLHAALLGLAPRRVFLLKFFPLLLHVPDWLPGSSIRREAKAACAWRDKVVEIPYQYVRKRMESGDNADTAMVFNHIVRMGKLNGSDRSEYETALKHAATTAFLGSSETASSMLMAFTLAMVQNPWIWKRAQASIDAVLGMDKFPEFDDLPSLPYIEAIVRETLRWRPVTPMLFPHAATCNDIYEGYYIPKGATIIANTWAMTRDEARYPNPDKFIPERFLDKDGQLTDDDPREFIFGFGRRKCPGRYTGDASVSIAIVTMLATLDFNLAKDADGNDITFEATFMSGITERADYFPCQLTLRPHLSRDMLGRILSN